MSVPWQHIFDAPVHVHYIAHGTQFFKVDATMWPKVDYAGRTVWTINGDERLFECLVREVLTPEQDLGQLRRMLLPFLLCSDRTVCGYATSVCGKVMNRHHVIAEFCEVSSCPILASWPPPPPIPPVQSAEFWPESVLVDSNALRLSDRDRSNRTITMSSGSDQPDPITLPPDGWNTPASSNPIKDLQASIDDALNADTPEVPEPAADDEAKPIKFREFL